MGAEYMTIFVTETNFARRIYEKAGFSAVQEWAILKRRYDRQEIRKGKVSYDKERAGTINL